MYYCNMTENINPTRTEWSARKTWSDGTFNSLERFVNLGTESQIRTLVETEDVRAFFDDLGGTPPEPLPAQCHVEYMVAYAENEVLTE